MTENGTLNERHGFRPDANWKVTADLGGTATEVLTATRVHHAITRHTPRGRTHPDASRWMGETAN
jgi:hypothetical protein